MRIVRTLLRPRWIVGHVVAVVFVIAFVMLGFWQLRRLDEKRTFNHAVTVALEAAPVPIADAPAGGYTRVMATGTYDPSVEALTLRSLDGTSGYHVLTPLVLADGAAVLVDRSNGQVKLPLPFFSCHQTEVIAYRPGECPLCAAGLPLVRRQAPLGKRDQEDDRQRLQDGGRGHDQQAPHLPHRGIRPHEAGRQKAMAGLNTASSKGKS